MASNCISHGRKCADTVPSNIGTFVLDALRVAALFSPLLVFIVIPIPLSCAGRSLGSRPRMSLSVCMVSTLSACVASVGVACITGDREKSDRKFWGAPGGEIVVLMVGA